VLAEHESWRGGGPVFVVVCEPGPDHDGGYAIYKVDNDKPAQHWVLEVRELVAADPEVEARLWRYVLDVDLVGTVTAEARPLDDPLPWRFADPRQVRTTDVRDYLYVRLLDIGAAFSARRFPVADRLVVQVADPFRPANDGCWAIAGDPGSSTCERTDDAPDLHLDIAHLGSLLLGGVSVRDLVRAGRIDPVAPEVVERADAFFRWPVAPFCITRF
jgi:predicted acetyltransferase